MKRAGRWIIINSSYAPITYNCATATSYGMKENVLSYTVIFEKVAEGGYVAFVPSLPGCMTQGETFEETKENAKDAMSGYLEVLKADGEDFPLEQEPISAIVSIPVAN